MRGLQKRCRRTLGVTDQRVRTDDALRRRRQRRVSVVQDKRAKSEAVDEVSAVCGSLAETFLRTKKSPEETPAIDKGVIRDWQGQGGTWSILPSDTKRQRIVESRNHRRANEGTL